MEIYFVLDMAALSGTGLYFPPLISLFLGATRRKKICKTFRNISRRNLSVQNPFPGAQRGIFFLWKEKNKRGLISPGNVAAINCKVLKTRKRRSEAFRNPFWHGFDNETTWSVLVTSFGAISRKFESLFFQLHRNFTLVQRTEGPTELIIQRGNLKSVRWANISAAITPKIDGNSRDQNTFTPLPLIEPNSSRWVTPVQATSRKGEMSINNAVGSTPH